MIISYEINLGIYNARTKTKKSFNDFKLLTSFDKTQIRGSINEEMNLSFAPGMIKIAATPASVNNKYKVLYYLMNEEHKVDCYLELGDIVYINISRINSATNAVQDELAFTGFIQEVKLGSNGDNQVIVQNATYHLNKMKYDATGKSLKKDMTSKGIETESGEETLSFVELVRKLVYDYNKVIEDRYELGGTLAFKFFDEETEIYDSLIIDPESTSKGFIKQNLNINTEFDLVNFRADKSTALEILEHCHKNYLVDFNLYTVNFKDVLEVSISGQEVDEEGQATEPVGQITTRTLSISKNFMFAGFLTTKALSTDNLIVRNLLLKNYDLRYENTFRIEKPATVTLETGEEVEAEGTKIEYIITNEDLKSEIENLDSNVKEVIEFEGFEPIVFFQVGAGYVTKKDLRWQKASDVQVNARFKIIGDNNKVTEFKFGTGGQTIDYVQFGNIKKEVLEQMAANRINKKKYTGYREGSMVQTYMTNFSLFDNLFLADIASKIETSDLENIDIARIEAYGEMQIIMQKFTVNKITHTFNESGFRTDIFLGNLLASNVVEEDNSKTNAIYDLTVPRLFATAEQTIVINTEERIEFESEVQLEETEIKK